MRRGVVAAVVAVTAVLPGQVARAGGNSEGGAVIGVSVSLSGFATPSIHWQDPCSGDEFSEYHAGQLQPPNYRDADTEVTGLRLTSPRRSALEIPQG